MLLYSGFTFLDKQKMAKSGPKTRFVLTPLCVTSIQTWPPIRPAGAQWEIFRLFYPPPFQNYSILIKFLCFVLNAKTLWMVIFDSSFKKMCLVRKKDILIFRREKRSMKNYLSLRFFLRLGVLIDLIHAFFQIWNIKNILQLLLSKTGSWKRKKKS